MRKIDAFFILVDAYVSIEVAEVEAQGFISMGQHYPAGRVLEAAEFEMQCTIQELQQHGYNFGLNIHNYAWQKAKVAYAFL